MVNIYKEFQKSDKPIPNPNLKLAKIVDESTVLKKIEDLKKRNAKLLRSSLDYKFRPVEIKRENRRVDMIFRPESIAQRNPTDEQQKAELLRMAKIYAYEYTNKYRNDPEKLEEKKQQFLYDYGGKIAKFNIYSRLNEIWGNMQDPNYREPLFDKNYLGQSASSEYMKSINQRIKNELLVKQLNDSVKVDDIISRVVKGKMKNFEELTPKGKIQALRNEIGALTQNLIVDREKLMEYNDEYSRLRSVFGTSIDAPDDVEMTRLADKIPKLEAKIAEQQRRIEEKTAQLQPLMIQADERKAQKRAERAEMADRLRREREQQERVSSLMSELEEVQKEMEKELAQTRGKKMKEQDARLSALVESSEALKQRLREFGIQPAIMTPTKTPQKPSRKRGKRVPQ